MDDAVVVGEAGGKGLGVFAARAFEPGELILRFQGRVVHRDDLAALTPWEREHLGELTAATYQVLPPPRCYLNHACRPNAVSSSQAVHAWRAITAGEEITIDYRLNAHDDGDVWEMQCLCDAHDAPHVVIGDFFTLLFAN
jgi:SET domain-containing protein